MHIRTNVGYSSSPAYTRLQAQQPSTMSGMLLHCPRGCRTAFVLRLATLYRSERTRDATYISLNRPYDRVAHTMGMTVRGVRQMVHRANTSSLSTPATPITPTVFDNFAVGAIRRHIHRRFADKQHLTLSVLSMELKAEGVIPEHTSETAVWRLIHTMGFKYKVSQRKMYVRRESPDVVCRRIGALRALQHYREEGMMVVYVDETCRQVPPGEGERFVVVAGGTAGGFVEGSYLCYPAKSSQGDYHGEMNGDLFQRWLTTHLLPSLPEPSVLVLDNAPYHSQLTEESRCPTTATKKADLISWLEHRSISIPPAAARHQLLLLCRQNRPEAPVVRLPPGYPELNAIEQVWGCMKSHVRSSLRRLTRADLQARLEEAKQLANKDVLVWLAAVRHSQNYEKGYWRSDNIHEPVGPVIINVASDDESEEDDDVFLDSDCD
ncbi:hypothetical protein O3P69_019074 [Scylla paramamosain]|uniref:Tc1-like transposase DDE domain-containing protein n=1 Tax=Scylla paramamosain TaxID=85552 RepID=A0AAW0T718_SCYPA